MPRPDNLDDVLFAEIPVLSAIRARAMRRQQPSLNPDYFHPETGEDMRFTQRGTEVRAQRRGQIIECATPHTLQLDIDSPEAYERFGELMEIWNGCESLPKLGRLVERDSRTPGHKHITIELDADFPVERRILFQALLGSDLKRELLSLASLENGHVNPIVFYRPSEESHATQQPQPEPANGGGRRACTTDFAPF